MYKTHMIVSYFSSWVHNRTTTKQGRCSKGFRASATSPSVDSPSVAMMTHAIWLFLRRESSIDLISSIISRIWWHRGVPTHITFIWWPYHIKLHDDMKQSSRLVNTKLALGNNAPFSIAWKDMGHWYWKISYLLLENLKEGFESYFFPVIHRNIMFLNIFNIYIETVNMTWDWSYVINAHQDDWVK